MDGFQLAVLFTTAGALAGAALVKTIISALKNLGAIPETGRGVMYAALALSAGLVGLALLDVDMLKDGVSGLDVLTIIMTVFGVYTASIGVHETAVKIQRSVSGTTNPDGPDVR